MAHRRQAAPCTRSVNGPAAFFEAVSMHSVCEGALPANRKKSVVRTNPKLDRIDLNILVQLQRDGRMSNIALADAVGLSPSPCLSRVKRLEQAGLISGYGAIINIPKITTSIIVFTEITLKGHTKEYFVKFETNLCKLEEVLECHLVSGGYDYLVKFTTRGLAHYQELIERLLELNVGISKYFSYVVMKSPIARNELPLAVLLGDDRR